MLSVAEARERILSKFQSVAIESIPLRDGLNRVLGTDIIAATDLPLFDNSSMDGFAILAADSHPAAASRRVTLRVVADISAGAAAATTLAPGESARIMTGAPIPSGADAVIPVEDTDFNIRTPGANAPRTVSFSRVVQIGENIRKRGTDARTGDVVLHAGKALRPQDVGLLAALGIAQIHVHKKPRVALFSSGDELLEVDAPLESGKIRDSNTYMLAALIENAGAECMKLGVAKDNRADVESLLEKAAKEKADLILSSAGVSVGAFDFVKEAIEANGKLDFWRVNMKPGKPIAFGEYRGIPFIGLPGNPVSAFAGFEVFAREAIGRLSGLKCAIRMKVRARSEEAIESDGRETYLRVEVREQDGAYVAALTGHQGSGNLLSLARANALLIIPAGVKSAPAGQEFEAWLL